MIELANPQRWGPGTGPMEWMMGGFFFLLFWGALIAFGIWAVRRFSERRPSDEAMRTLRERYARGEIDSEEFDRRRKALEV
jgi:putative membrane protein